MIHGRWITVDVKLVYSFRIGCDKRQDTPRMFASIVRQLPARNYMLRRHLTRSCAASYSTAEATKSQLRTLLRETAQPVAVVTAFMPPDASRREQHNPAKTAFHGATLSSFTSIAMDPIPLVTFALRIPSRMASALNRSPPNSPSDMVINLLCANQASIATSFSRPDLHPHPFSTTPYFLTADGLPVIRGSLGAISCKLVSKGLPLHDARFFQPRQVDEPPYDPPPSQVVSELFIAQVMRVEVLENTGEEGHDLPLLYHRRMFTSCIPGDTSTA
ncbi:flavin reductase like domain-containing protein [Mycena rosella]|uniref:Flavin reductase like domain-containing protein n=1 Tax=Mycena rosella TaxID=1033263 RepID=A0AAD7MB44_MYCRO|nr:flavin reductase like domain-containing protein [Mycena rosella]